MVFTIDDARGFILGTTRHTRDHLSAAAIVTTLQVDALGHRTLVVDRSPRSERDRPAVGISIHAASLRANDHDAVLPGPGQLRLG